ncbi:MAG: CPBP family intramembrane metalloprotease [Clostridiales bacterium]|jgi:membrane protease YdiL (CAAX protease family)|nr:CPBP family intramembrane metalloprotease [Clostridiales bacterium]
MTGYNANEWQPYTQDEDKLRNLRRDSNFVGFISIAQLMLLQLTFIIILYILAAVGVVKSFNDEYYGLGSTSFLILYSLSYTIGMGLPAPVIAVIARRRFNPFSRLDGERGEEQIKFHTVILGLLAGMAVCIIANFAASYLAYFFESIGIPSPKLPDYLETNIQSLGFNIFIFALLPAVFEEMVYRGYILRTLRSYGDTFAIVVSSILFALMHGNLLQIPFALIVGLAFGYLVVKTGRIWVAMTLHFLNNFMSLLLTYSGKFMTTEQSQKATLIVFAIVAIIGLFSYIILNALYDPIVRRIKPQPGKIATSRLAGNLLLAPAMIAGLVIALLLTTVNTFFGG